MKKIFNKNNLNTFMHIMMTIIVIGTAYKYIAGGTTPTEFYLTLCFVELVNINMNFWTLFDKLSKKDETNS